MNPVVDDLRSGMMAVIEVWRTSWEPWARERWPKFILDDTEHRRLRGLRYEPDQSRSIVGHVLARVVLSQRLDVAPESLRLIRRCDICGNETHGKPRLVSDVRSDDIVHFSLSHAASAVAVAVADVEVGIDIETPASAHIRDAELALSEAELRKLALVDGDARSVALARCWTRKEAVLKASGYGLRVDPTTVEIGGPTSQPTLIASPPCVRRPMRLADLEPRFGVVGCVAAITREPLRIVERDGERTLHQAAENYIGASR